MLDQLFDIVKGFGKETVVDNPEVPNEHNSEVMADATKTIASGFQNVLAGGGFQNILDLFKGGGSSSNTAGNSGGGIGGLLKNPIVTMMIGYFISKLVSKYKMSPSTASSVANNLIPNALNGLISKTNDPNSETTLDGIIGSLTGGGAKAQTGSAGGGSQLQDILDNFSGGGNGNSDSGGFNLQDIIGQLTNKAQNNFQETKGGGGLMDIIKGFIK